jgi:hypothetical protein
MNWLAKDLGLSIALEGDPECLILYLSNPSSHGMVTHQHEVGTNTENRAYHRKEALVIAMRQLVSKAVEQNLISVCPGASKTSSIGSGSGRSTMSSTDWGF